MKVLVAIKRVVDPNIKVRVKTDGSAVETANVKMAMNPFCEIAVEQALIVGELQGRGDGARVGDDSLERYSRARRVKLSQVPMRRIVHHQVRGLVLDAKVEDADDMRMHQVAQVPRFREKVLGSMCVHLGVQDFDGNLAIEVDMLAQVDVGKGTFP